MKKIESVLRFENYIVKSVNFRINDLNNDNKNSWNLDFDVNSNIKYNEERNKMQVELSVEVFKDVDDAPFYIDATIVGNFEMLGKEDISKFKANAIAIMYPYLRSIISTYTAASNVNSLILPAININAMLEDKQKREN